MAERNTVVRMLDKVIEVDDAQIVYKHFGEEDSRGFTWRFYDPTIADELCKRYVVDGHTPLNVKEKMDNDGNIYYDLDIKIKPNNYGPKIYVRADGNKAILDLQDYCTLDKSYIVRFDFDFRVYPYDYKGRTGMAAALNVAQADIFSKRDRFADDIPVVYEDED